MSAPSLRRAGLVMVAVTIAARGFGYIREAVVASAFGVSVEVDLFLTAFIIPAVLITTAYYSIPNAFVPLWAAPKARERVAVTAALSTASAALMTAVVIGIFAEPVASLIAGGFPPELQQRAAALLRIGVGAVFFAVVEALLRSRLLAAKQFGLPSLSYVWQGVGIIAAVVGWKEFGADAMMWGALAGGAISVLWNVVLLYLSKSQSGIADGDVPATLLPSRSIAMWILFVLLTDSLSQLYGIVDRRLGSYLEPGAIAALNYASLVAGLPSAVIGFALSTAIFPFLSDAAAGQDNERIQAIIHRAVHWSLLFAIPATVWMLVYRDEIIGILFQRGAFDAGARGYTSAALGTAALGIVPLALATVWSRILYASQNWIPILACALAALMAKFAFSIWAQSAWGMPGLALATSGAYVVSALTIGWVQRDRLKCALGEWSRASGKILVLVGLPAIVFLLVLRSTDPGTSAARYGIALAGVASGMVTLLGIGSRWGITQVSDVLNYLRLRAN